MELRDKRDLIAYFDSLSKGKQRYILNLLEASPPWDIEGIDFRNDIDEMTKTIIVT